jgi:hypothetical protein
MPFQPVGLRYSIDLTTSPGFGDRRLDWLLVNSPLHISISPREVPHGPTDMEGLNRSCVVIARFPSTSPRGERNKHMESTYMELRFEAVHRAACFGNPSLWVLDSS